MIWIVGILAVCVVILGFLVFSQEGEFSELRDKHIWASNEIYTLKTQLEAVPKLEAKVANLEAYRLEQVIPKKRKDEIRAAVNMKLTPDEKTWKDSLVPPAQVSKADIAKAQQDWYMKQAKSSVNALSDINREYEAKLGKR